MTTLRSTSILLGTTDPERLRAFYERAFDLTATESWMQLGTIGLLIDGRDDVNARNSEPGRVVLTVDTDDTHAIVQRLNDMGVRWVCELEERPDGLFSTFEDPDGNLVQVLQMNEQYLARTRTAWA